MEEKNDKWVFAVSAFLLLVAIVMIFMTSCYTPKAALRDRDKIVRNYPIILTDYCNEKYPSINSTIYLPGKTDTVPNTVTVDCDSLIKAKNKDSSKLSSPNKFNVPCPPSTSQHDTFKVTERPTVELAAKDSVISQLNKDLTAANLKAAKSKKSSVIWMWLFIGIIVLDAVIIYLFFRRAFKLGNIL